MKHIASVLLLTLTGCQTQGYQQYADAMARIAEANASVAREQAQAMLSLATHGGDQTTRTVAVIMLAMGAQNGRANLQVAPPINEPLEWTRVLAGPITAGLLGFFSYKQAMHLSDNNADVSIAGYGAMQGIANSGFAAVSAFKPVPFDWSGLANLRPNVNVTTDITNRDGLVVIGGDGTQAPVAIVPPVVVVPTTGPPVFGP